MTTAEDCDDGNTNNGDGCASDCTVEVNYTCDGDFGSSSYCYSTCGNSIREDVPIVETAEECDDGNTTGGDGCDSSCMIEDDFGCTGDFGEETVCVA